VNEQQRFRASLAFGRPDKLSLLPGDQRESTLAAWHQQGLPQNVDWYPYLMQTLGIDRQLTQPRVSLGVSFQMIPTFEEKVLEHRDGHYIVQNWMGATTEISDRYDYTYLRAPKDFVTRKWHRFPVQNRQDWEKMKWRYDPHHPGRFPADFDERCEALSDRDYVLRLDINGPFWQLREWCGFEGLCIFLIDEPDFVQEMIEFWSAFVVQVLEPTLNLVEPDYVQIAEDMAYKQHSMISPSMARGFLLPVWEKWVSAMKARGCPVISMDSDGYVAELLPLWVEAGFNCRFPVEVAAGNDIVGYRREYGEQMAYMGGIDKRAMAAGGMEMRDEVLRVVPPLLEQGGFIPQCDHGVPPDISWPNYAEYSRLLAQLTGWL